MDELASLSVSDEENEINGKIEQKQNELLMSEDLTSACSVLNSETNLDMM